MAFSKRAAELWRDFVTPPNPLSGLWQPPKAWIRDWGTEIETQLAAILVQLQALAAAAGFDPSIFTALQSRLTSVETKQTRNDATLALVSPRVTDKTQRPRIVMGRPRRSLSADWYEPIQGGTAFGRWGFVIVPTRDIPGVARFTVWMPSLYVAPFLRISIWSRPVADADTYGPGAGPNDVPVFGRDFAAADIADAPMTNPVAQAVRFDIRDAPGPWTTDRAYCVVISGFQVGGAAAAVGMALAVDPPAGAPARDRGWYSAIGGGWAGMNPNQALAYELGEAYGVGQIDADKPVSLTVASREPVQVQTAGLSYTLPEIAIERGGASIVKPKTAAIAGDIGRVTKTERRTLRYNVAAYLGSPYLSNITVTRVDNGAALGAADVTINATQGLISGVKNVAAYDVDVTWTADNQRIDILCVDQQTGAYASAVGTVRQGDVAEFVPSVPPGFIPLYMIHLTSTRGLEVIPIHQFQDQVHVGKVGRHLFRLERNRQRLPNLARLMARGAPIKLLGYGDSITNLGPFDAASVTVPNGIYRDRIGTHFDVGRLGADVLATIDLFDHGDGAGQIHHHLGWNWALKDAIERRSGSVVTYLNMGVPGSHTGPEQYNGSNTTRLNAAVAQAADVAVLAFGMNEIGSTATYSQIRTIIAAMKRPDAQGRPQCDVIVVGVPLIPSLLTSVDRWLFTNDELERAAEDEGVAFVSFAELANPDNLGGMGLPRRAMCSANGFNHPGPTEMRKYGRWLAKIVPPVGGTADPKSAYLAMLASLPPLPANDADIPDDGGLYLDGGQPRLIPPKS